MPPSTFPPVCTFADGNPDAPCPDVDCPEHFVFKHCAWCGAPTDHRGTHLHVNRSHGDNRPPLAVHVGVNGREGRTIDVWWIGRLCDVHSARAAELRAEAHA
jgi:hypothetical protein